MALFIPRCSRQICRQMSKKESFLPCIAGSMKSQLKRNQTRQFHALAELPETHEMLRKTCRDYADEVLKPIAGDIDRNHRYPAEQVCDAIKRHKHFKILVVCLTKIE